MLFGRRKLKAKTTTPAAPAQPPGEGEPPAVTVAPPAADAAPVPRWPRVGGAPAGPLPPPFMGGEPLPAAEVGADLTIDCAAVTQNWRTWASRAAPADCAAVVKADAYGCGIEPITSTLAAAGCSPFFVAQLAEARPLRVAAPAAVI